MFAFIKKLAQFFGGKQVKTNFGGERVRYHFHFPGIRNFHLLPYKSKKPPLNIFRPHWTGSFRPMTKVRKFT